MTSEDLARPLAVGVEADRRWRGALVDDLRSAVGDSVDVVAAPSIDALVALLDSIEREQRRVALVAIGDIGDAELRSVVTDVAARHPAAQVIAIGARGDDVEALLGDGLVRDVLGHPWRPAAVSFDDVMTDAVEEWRSLQDPDTGTVTLIGRPADPTSFELRDLFTRNPVPHRYFDDDEDEAQTLLDELGLRDLERPIVVAPNGSVLGNPSREELWTALGEQPGPPKEHYELIVLGAGPAGLAVAINAASEGIDTLLLECFAPGGQAGSSSRIENYVGFPSGVSGTELARRAFNQVRRLGADPAGITPADHLERLDDGSFQLSAGADYTVTGEALVLATGLTWNKLPAEGADRFEGAGVFYGAARAEARSMAGRDLVIVGGANSAGQAAVFFADVARRVTMVVRGSRLGAKMSQYLVDQLAAFDNVDVRLNTEVTGVAGDESVERVTLETPDGETELDVDGVFVFIGATPRTDWLPDWLERDDRGYIVTGRGGADPDDGVAFAFNASEPGVFAVGDVRAGSVKRVASAIGEGSIVVPAIHDHLARRASASDS